MKTALRLLMCLLVMAAAIPAMAQKASKIQFETTTVDLGTVKEKGGKVSMEFPFKNVGDAPLVITSCYASCGCTKPDYPEDPIAPGASSVIKVTYDPNNRPGEINKTVTVRTNDKSQRKIVLKFTGLVTPGK